MALLTGPEIRKRIACGDIQIDPYAEARVQAASVDLTLGTEFLTYDAAVHVPDHVIAHRPVYPNREVHFLPNTAPALHDTQVPLDARSENPTTKHQIPIWGFVLQPGILYLMHTAERIHTLKYACDVSGKSSIGRLSILVHHTAGYIDPGFDGQVTLEVAVVHPVTVYAGMEFCQARFFTLEGEVEDYRLKGHYKGESAKGPQGSRSWQQGLYPRQGVYNRGAGTCQSGQDGECYWEECPQIRDGEPRRSGRHCPLWKDPDEE